MGLAGGKAKGLSCAGDSAAADEDRLCGGVVAGLPAALWGVVAVGVVVVSAAVAADGESVVAGAGRGGGRRWGAAEVVSANHSAYALQLICPPQLQIHLVTPPHCFQAQTIHQLC